MRKYGGSGFQAEKMSRAEALSTVLSARLPGAEHANKSRLHQVGKPWPKEVRGEGRSDAKKFGSFLNQQAAIGWF